MNGTRCAALIASPLAFRAQARALSLSLCACLSLSLSLSLSALFFSSSFLPKYLSSNLFKEISFISILLLLLSDVAGLSSLLFFFFFLSCCILEAEEIAPSAHAFQHYHLLLLFLLLFFFLFMFLSSEDWFLVNRPTQSFSFRVDIPYLGGPVLSLGGAGWDIDRPP